MNAIRFQVLGVPQVVGRFAKAAVMAEEFADIAADELAEEVATVARQLCPIGKTDEVHEGAPGDLRDSIRTEGGTVIAGNEDVNYAGYVEYGTHEHGDAQPFIRPAADTVDTDHALLGVAALLRRL